MKFNSLLLSNLLSMTLLATPIGSLHASTLNSSPPVAPRTDAEERTLIVIVDKSNKSNGGILPSVLDALYHEQTVRSYTGVVGDFISQWRDTQPKKPWHLIIATADFRSSSASATTIELPVLTSSMSVNTKLTKAVAIRRQVLNTLREPVRSYRGTQLLKALEAVLRSPNISRPATVVLVSNLFEQDSDVGVDFGLVLGTSAVYTDKSHKKFVEQLSSAMDQLGIRFQNDQIQLFVTTSDTTQGKYMLALGTIWSRALKRHGAGLVQIGSRPSDFGWTTSSN